MLFFIMVDFVQYSQQLVSSRADNVPQPLLERAKVVLGEEERTVVTPILLNDLGVRRNKGVSQYFNECVRAGLIPDQHRLAESEAYISKQDIDSYGDLVEKYVQFVGDYESALRATTDILHADLSILSYDTLLYTGVLYGALGNGFSLKLFDAAYSSTDNSYMAVSVLHRKAIVLTKRFAEHDSAKDILTEVIMVSSTMEAAAALETRSLAYNALALVERNLGHHDLAEEMLMQSLAGVPEYVQNVDHSDSRLARYYLQEIINFAQLKLAKGEVSDANRLMSSIEEVVKSKITEYTGEFYGIRAAIRYRAGDYVDALADTLIAIERGAALGSPDALKAARKIAIASLSKLGRNQHAELVLDSLENDTIGLKIVKDKEVILNAIES